MHFKLAYPREFSQLAEAPGSVAAFYRQLTEVLTQAGHTWQVFDHTVLPDADPASDVIRVGYHSCGRAPATWHVKRSYLTPRFYVDRDGYAGWSEMACSAELFQQSQHGDLTTAASTVSRWKQNYFDRGRTKQPQPVMQFEARGRPFVLLPLQIPADRVMALSRVDYYDFARHVADALADGPELLVVKRHPACGSPDVFRLLAELSRRPHVRITTASIHSLLTQASAVVCINSGVGFEALFYGCTVVTAGYSDYEWVTTQLRTLDDVRFLPRLIREPPDRDRVLRFLSYFCNQYLYGVTDRNRLAQWVEMATRGASASDG